MKNFRSQTVQKAKLSKMIEPGIEPGTTSERIVHIVNEV